MNGSAVTTFMTALPFYTSQGMYVLPLPGAQSFPVEIPDAGLEVISTLKGKVDDGRGYHVATV